MQVCVLIDATRAEGSSPLFSNGAAGSVPIFSRMNLNAQYQPGFNVLCFPIGPLGQQIRVLLAPCMFSLARQPKHLNKIYYT